MLNALSLVLPLLLGLAFRIPQITTPFIGVQGWNEAHYTSEGHNYVQTGEWLIQAGVDGVDPTHTPILTWQIGILTLLLGYAEWVPRTLIIIYAELTIVTLYYLVRGIHGRTPATIGAVIFATIPLGAFLGRTVQLDTVMIFYYVAALYVFFKTVRTPEVENSHRKLYLTLLCGLLSGLAVATKYTTLFLIIPIAGWFLYKTLTTSLRAFITHFLPFLALTVLPTVLWLSYVTLRWSLEFWVWYISQGPPGWLGENLLQLASLEVARFYGYTYGLTALLGSAGILLLLRKKFENRFVLLTGASAMLFLLVYARNSYMLDYYLFILSPFVVVSAANLISACQDMNRYAGIFITLLVVSSSAYVYTASPFLALDYNIYDAGLYLRQNTSPTEIVVAGVPQIAYYAERKSIFYYSLDFKTDDDIIILLETSQVRLIALGQYKAEELAARRPTVYEYVTENYHLAASFGEWNIWQRSP